MSARPPVRRHGPTRPATGRVFMKFDMSILSEKPVVKIQAALKSDKNIWYFRRRSVYICDNISLSYSWNEKYFT